jgi:hypothetical protein
VNNKLNILSDLYLNISCNAKGNIFPVDKCLLVSFPVIHGLRTYSPHHVVLIDAGPVGLESEEQAPSMQLDLSLRGCVSLNLDLHLVAFLARRHEVGVRLPC